MIKIKVRRLNAIEQIKGLMFLKKAQPVLINTRWGIHTFGVNFPIDIIILDKDNRVVKIKKDLKPNRIFLWNPKFARVLELPQNTQNRFKIGDKLTLQILN